MVKTKQILHNLFSGLHGFFLFSLVFRLSVFYAKTAENIEGSAAATWY